MILQSIRSRRPTSSTGRLGLGHVRNTKPYNSFKGVLMEKICKICENKFETIDKGHSRIYCFECSPNDNSGPLATNTHHKTQLRRSMKKQAVKIKGGKCQICGYNKCIDALVFHHTDPLVKEFGLSNGETRSWEKYLKELEKCILVCANCHAEIHIKNNEGL